MAALLWGLALIAPRFWIALPSRVDDWSQLRFAPRAWHQLLDLHYDPSTFDPQRYRPAFYGPWSELQWHTLGAPEDMLGPNLWNVLRLALFSFALAALVLVCLRGRDVGGTGVRAALAATPALLTLATPNLGVDFARFGPQEPLFVGSVVVALLLLVAVIRRLADRRAEVGASTFALYVVALALWTFGIFTKEAALALVTLAPFAVVAWRPLEWPSPGRRRLAVASIGVFALPWLWLAWKVAHLYTGGNELVYNAERPNGITGWIGRVFEVAVDQWSGIGDVAGSPIWTVLFLVVPAAIVAVGASRRRVPWLAAALAATAWAFLVFQGLAGLVESRYYIPVVALIAASAVVLTAELPARAPAVWIAVVVAFVGVNAVSARRAVLDWVDGEKTAVTFVKSVAALEPSRCPVYITGIGREMEFSLPVLLAINGEPAGACHNDWAGLLVQGKYEVIDGADQAMVATCAPPGFKWISTMQNGDLLACRRFLPGTRDVRGKHRLTATDSPTAS